MRFQPHPRWRHRSPVGRGGVHENIRGCDPPFPRTTSLDLRATASLGLALRERCEVTLTGWTSSDDVIACTSTVLIPCIASASPLAILSSSPSSQDTLEPENMQLENGKTYKVTNAKGGTVLDLSGGQDQSPITGYNFSGGDNQKVRVSLGHP